MNPMTEHIEEKLGRYVRELEEALAADEMAENRSRYRRHLEAALAMQQALQHGKAPNEFVELIRSEIHSYGWDYISGPVGERAEASWQEFKKATGVRI